MSTPSPASSMAESLPYGTVLNCSVCWFSPLWPRAVASPCGRYTGNSSSGNENSAIRMVNVLIIAHRILKPDWSASQISWYDWTNYPRNIKYGYVEQEDGYVLHPQFYWSGRTPFAEVQPARLVWQQQEDATVENSGETTAIICRG